jgi:hypothetical protein
MNSSVKPVKPAAKVAAKSSKKPVAKVIGPKPVAKPAVKAAITSKVVAKLASKSITTRPVSPPKAVSPIMRDSFTMTTADQELLKKCKLDAIKSGRDSTKKSEVVRAALRHFASLAPATQLMELNQLDPVKTGRPKKQKK